MTEEQAIKKTLQQRSKNKCELCKTTENLSQHILAPDLVITKDNSVIICETCASQIDSTVLPETNHWQCLKESMWSEVPAVQVLAWRMLTRLKENSWAQDLLDIMYVDDETLKWAQQVDNLPQNNKIASQHKDSNGVALSLGDNVILTKDLNVKGANFTAKRGTLVKNIVLVTNNSEQIEGKINHQRIVILTKYVKIVNH